MLNIGQRLWDESGATAFEYGLILGLAALISFGGIMYFYGELDNLFGRWGDWFSSPSSSSISG